jgi:alpha-tubulin suppressor-like RCC1 family protein
LVLNEPKYTEVFVWGDDSCGQLGLELHKKIQQHTGNSVPIYFYRTPKSCSFNVLIKKIACGANHSAMLTNSGHLYMMGSNSHGQLGIGIGQGAIDDTQGASS